MARSEWRPGQVVWAKVTGYRWWPSLVDTVKSSRVTVKFLGEASHAVLQPSKVRDFRAHFDALSKTPRKGKSCSKFSAALAEAQRLLGEQPTPGVRSAESPAPVKKPHTEATLRLPLVQPLVFTAPTLSNRAPGIKPPDEDASEIISEQVPLRYLCE